MRLGLISVNEGKPFANREWLAGAVKRYDEPVHLILGRNHRRRCTALSLSEHIGDGRRGARFTGYGIGIHALATIAIGVLPRSMNIGWRRTSIFIPRSASHPLPIGKPFVKSLVNPRTKFPPLRMRFGSYTTLSTAHGTSTATCGSISPPRKSLWPHSRLERVGPAEPISPGPKADGL